MLVRSPGAAGTASNWMSLMGDCSLALRSMEGPFDELDWACWAVRKVTVTGSLPLLMRDPTSTPAAPLALETRTRPRACTAPRSTSIPSAGWYSTVVWAGDWVEHAPRAAEVPT